MEKKSTDMHIIKDSDQNNETTSINAATIKLWTSQTETLAIETIGDKQSEIRCLQDGIRQSDSGVDTPHLQRMSSQTFENHSNLKKKSAEFFSPNIGTFKTKLEEKKLQIDEETLMCSDVTNQ